MVQVLLGPQKVHIVCRYQRHAEFAAEPLRFAQYTPVSWREALHFDVQAAAEKFFKLGAASCATTRDLITRSCWQGAQRDHAAAVFRQFVQCYWPAIGFGRIHVL